MSYIIDVALALILVFFAWKGFKNGFLRAVIGLVAVIAAIYGANLVAKTYAENFTDTFRPFVAGVVDKALIKNTPSGNIEDVQQDTQQPEGSDKSSVFDVSLKILQSIGVSDKASGLIAGKVNSEVSTVGEQLKNNLTDRLTEALAYIAVFAAAFIAIAIVFAVIGKLINLVHILPGIETADRLIGLILGLLKGALIVFAIAVIIRYFGLVSPEAIEKTTFLKYITNVNPLADILGI